MTSRSFTTTGNGLLEVLINTCRVSEAFDPSGAHPEMLEFNALWDTGATGCVITQSVVDACGLVSTGRAIVKGVHGESEVDTFLVNIYLPNDVGFSQVLATIGDFGKDADVLIGMNIISKGDFAVTNLDGITKFSFRLPSEVHIDFEEETRRTNLVPQFQHGGSKRNTNRQKPAKKGGRTK